MNFDDLIHMRILEREIEVLQGRFKETGTGNIRTAVDILQRRVDEIEDNISKMIARK